MQTKRWYWMSAAVVILVVGVLFTLLGLPLLNSEAKATNWVGSWDTQVTVKVQNATFPSLVTLGADGLMLTDESPSPLETSGHGSWNNAGENKAVYTFIFLIGNTNGTDWIKGTVSGEIQYNPKNDTWSGPFTIRMVDQAGNEIMSDTGTMTSKRIAPKNFHE